MPGVERLSAAVDRSRGHSCSDDRALHGNDPSRRRQGPAIVATAATVRPNCRTLGFQGRKLPGEPCESDASPQQRR